MLLSIVMMVKNEERYLDKTLYALNDLRKDIDTELIILDTGSTDSTVEIAKKYTDKVYFSKWNDNFADMRNISISYAKKIKFENQVQRKLPTICSSYIKRKSRRLF